jgi:signal transduction histidine kinase
MSSSITRSGSAHLPRPALGIAAFLLLIIVGVSYREWDEYHKINSAARESRHILETVDQIRSGVLDAETSSRGFLLTGDATYLEPYHRVLPKIPSEVSKLENLMANRSGAGLAAELKDLIQRKFADVAQLIELRRRLGYTPSVQAIVGDPGRRLMDRIRTLCSEIDVRESASHGEAEAGREAAARTALLATVAGSLILLFFFVAGFQPLLSGERESGPQHNLRAYTVVLAVLLMSTLLRMSLTPLIGATSAPFITYFPAVLFAAWYGGFRAGAVAILLSTAAAWYYFVEPARSFQLSNPGDIVGSLLYIFVSFGIVLLSESQRRAVADRRDAENAEREMRLRVEGLNRELARSNQDLQAFASMASHDLQEPLRMIGVYSQLLVRKFPRHTDPDAAMFAGNIEDGVSRMQKLLSDLLTFARLGGPASEQAEPVDVNHAVENAIRNLRAAIDSSGAEIVYGELPWVSAAETHLVSLFQNLIGNAIKYRAECPPVIRISAERRDGMVRFAVSDNGIGIAPEYHDRVFAAFERLHGKKVPGSGIGLAICKRMVERYGGRIWVESEEGRGATFYVTLRAAQRQGATMTTGMARANRTID